MCVTCGTMFVGQMLEETWMLYCGMLWVIPNRKVWFFAKALKSDAISRNTLRDIVAIEVSLPSSYPPIHHIDNIATHPYRILFSFYSTRGLQSETQIPKSANEVIFKV